MQLNFNYLVNFCLLEFAVPEMMPMVMTGRKRKGYLHNTIRHFIFKKFARQMKKYFRKIVHKILKHFSN